MGVRYEDLRNVCQKPVADGNDVAGLLFGDKASLPITKFLVDTGLSPSVATVGMLVTGVVGSVLQFGGPWLVVAGAMLLLLYYILDCVDGEVARWRRIEHARWGYYEYIFHFIVKPVCFLCVGFSIWRHTDQWVLLLAGVSAAVSTLWLKLFLGLPSIVFVGSVFGRGFSGDRPYREYLPEAEAKVDEQENGSRGGKREVFRLRADLVTLRSLATNFDVGLLLLLLASVADVYLAPFELPLLGATSLRTLWLLYYGLVLPLDFFDYVRTYFRQGHFDRQMVRLLAGAHGFAIPGKARMGHGPAVGEDGHGDGREGAPGGASGEAAEDSPGNPRALA